VHRPSTRPIACAVAPTRGGRPVSRGPGSPIRRAEGVATGLALGLLAGVLAGCGPGEPAPGIVLVVLDTLRADRLGCLGGPRPASPHLDALAAEGVLFEEAVAHASWTLPSMAALLAGRLPTATVFDGRLRESLVEQLADAGFETAAFTEGGYVSATFGLDLGFGLFREQEGEVGLFRGGGEAGKGGIERTFAAAVAWLGQVGDRPFFLLVHTYEVHAPYRRRHFARDPPPPGLGPTFELADVLRIRRGLLPVGPREQAWLEALYDGGVLEADRHVGELDFELRRLGLAGRTTLAVTSDHGEDLGGRFPNYAGDHGHALYEEQIRVPLLLRGPGLPAGRRIRDPVRLVDLLPTLLEIAGLAPPPGLDGRSLLPLLRGGDPPPPETLLRTTGEAGKPARVGLRSGRFKLVVSDPLAHPRTPSMELFDLEHDPAERHNLAEEEPELRARLRARLRTLRTRERTEGPPRYALPRELPAELEARLRALGYLPPSAPGRSGGAGRPSSTP